MKFSQVPVGELFNFQGQDYTKSGPLTATTESDGKSKLIPRSANVKVLGNVKIETSVVDEKLLSSNDVVDAVNVCHEKNLDFLNTLKYEINPELIADMQIQLNSYYQTLINTINNMTSTSR